MGLMNLPIIFSLILYRPSCVQGISTWTYGSEDVGWTGQCSKGASQSPINLGYSSSKPIEKWTWSNSYSYKLNFTVTNDGTSLSLKFDSPSSKATVSGAELDGEFVLSYGTVHWGSTDYEGSEHQMQGKSHAMEIQLVHYNSIYSSLKNAEGKKDGLAILSTLYKVNAISERENEMLGTMIDSIANVIEAGTSTTIEMEPSNLRARIPSPLYRYTGSLTTPPCTENVAWTVFYHVGDISKAQLNKLRELKNFNGDKMENTFRSVKQLNDRKVIIGSAYLDKKEVQQTKSESVKKDFLQLGVKTMIEEKSWLEQPAPMWTAVAGGVLVLAAVLVGAWFLMKRRISTHMMVPSDDLEME